MAKYCDARQYQFSHLSHLRDEAWVYTKVHTESLVPQLEAIVSYLHIKLSEATRSCDALGNQAKKVPQLEAENKKAQAYQLAFV